MRRERQLMYCGTLDVAVPASNDATQKTRWPAVETNWVGTEWIEFWFWLVQINGAPTAAKLTAKFQLGYPSIDGNEWATPAWTDFDDNDVALRCLGGQAWGATDPVNGVAYPRATDKTPGVLHDSAISGGNTVGYGTRCRLVAPPGMVRIVLAPTFTGGTSPSYRITGGYERVFAA